MRRLHTNYSELLWSVDETEVTKRRSATPDSLRRFRNELRVNRLLASHRPPVRTAALRGFDVHHRSITFEAINGDTLGPKYPNSLSLHMVDNVVQLARALTAYQPRRRWFRRLDVTRRLNLAERAGLLTMSQASALRAEQTRHPLPLRFAHGDLTARNVMRDERGVVLIDWEWAGLYPRDYDLAFLWFSLVDVHGGREQIERSLPSGPRSFLTSALLIQLWHLEWFVAPEFRAKHLATRDLLLTRLAT